MSAPVDLSVALGPLALANPILTASGTFGYGLGIMEWRGWLGHAGAIFGYSTWMLHHPEQDATVIVLANRGETEQEFASAITFEIVQTLFS